MYLDNFYFVVSNIEKSIEFYSALLDAKPSATTMGENGLRWAEWRREDSAVYFGIISTEAAGDKIVQGNNGVLGLYADDIDAAYAKCCELGAKILYKPEDVPGSKDHYRCFAIEDSDGNKIEISYYDR